MIKLFRNTRRKLLAENKFSKYLVYAVGEIFLVVVGILIALWINNANQERINEQKAKVILKEIQRDLKKDIEGSKRVINTFINHDSIARLLLWDKFTADQMFGYSHKGKFFEIVYNSITFETSNNGYVNFNRNLNSIPTKYDGISNELKDLYDIRGEGVAFANERMKSIVFENIDEINNFDWNVASVKSGVPEEGKYYYMQDLGFKKQLLQYMNGIANIFVATELYRRHAVQLHNKISEILSSDTMLPSPGRLNTAQSALALNNILGTYKLKESRGIALPPIMELRVVDNLLNIRLSKDRQFKYFLYDETTFFNASSPLEVGNLNNIKFTKSEPKEFFVVAGKSIYAYYTKIED